MHTLLCQEQRKLSSKSLRKSGTQRSQVCVCLCSQQNPFQLGSPSPDSMRTALPPESPGRVATWRPHRPVFRESRRPVIARPYRGASSSPLHQQPQPPLVSTHFRCDVCGHRTLTSRVAAGHLGTRKPRLRLRTASWVPPRCYF